MKRVFLVDDHPLVREWLTQLIDQQPDLTVCGEAASAAAALATLGAAAADLAIVQRVVEAVRRVLESKLYVSEKAAEILAAQTVRGRAPDQPAIERLSDRELEVFEKLGPGIGTRQIAEEFSVSIKTVQAYCARIKEKLNVGSATELLREAVRWHDAKLSG